MNLLKPSTLAFFLLFGITSFSQDTLAESNTEKIERTSEEKKEKHTDDVLIATGTTMIGCGILTWFGSRALSIPMMITGGVVATIGTTIKVFKKLDK